MILREVTVSSDREGIEDAIFRFVEGIDKRDAELLASAFAEDIEFDLGGLDASLGSFVPYVGRDVTVGRLMSHVGELDTICLRWRTSVSRSMAITPTSPATSSAAPPTGTRGFGRLR